MSWQARVDSDERETAGLWGQLVLGMKWGGADQRPHRVGCLPSLSISPSLVPTTVSAPNFSRRSPLN